MCGTFDNNDDNDFTASNGVIMKDNPHQFALSYKINDARCTDSVMSQKLCPDDLSDQWYSYTNVNLMIMMLHIYFI